MKKEEVMLLSSFPFQPTYNTLINAVRGAFVVKCRYARAVLLEAAGSLAAFAASQDAASRLHLKVPAKKRESDPPLRNAT